MWILKWLGWSKWGLMGYFLSLNVLEWVLGIHNYYKKWLFMFTQCPLNAGFTVMKTLDVPVGFWKDVHSISCLVSSSLIFVLCKFLTEILLFHKQIIESSGDQNIDIVDKSLTNEIAVPGQYLFSRDSCQLTFVIVRKTSREWRRAKRSLGRRGRRKRKEDALCRQWVNHSCFVLFFHKCKDIIATKPTNYACSWNYTCSWNYALFCFLAW